MIRWLLGILLAATPPAHEFYLSVFYVEIHPERQTVEMSIKVFTDDFEQALRERFGQAVFMDQADTLTPYVMKYLQERVKISDGSKNIQLHWVGLESDPDVTWIYVESKTGVSGNQLRFQISFFQELFSSQTNIVHLQYKGRKKSAFLTKNKSQYQFEL
jgi:hypothetical protein